SLAEESPGFFRHPDDETGLALRVRHPVVGVLRRQAELEHLVLPGDLGVRKQIVAEEQPVPVLVEARLHHVDVVGAGAAGRVALDEPGVEGWAVLPAGRPPEVVVALRLQEGAMRTRVASRSATSTSMSTTGFAARPGTAVLPKCSTRRIRL